MFEITFKSFTQDQVKSETITIRPSNYETATENTMAREKEIEANRRKEDTEGNIPQEVEREAEQIPATGEKACSETTTCFLFKSRLGEFLGRNKFKTIGQKTNSSYEDGGGYDRCHSKGG